MTRVHARPLAMQARIATLRRRVAQRGMRLLFRRGAARAAACLPATGIHRILVCRSVRTLGDSLTLTPLLQALAATWPGAEIDLVSRCPVAAEIYGGYFGIGRIIRLPTHVPGHPLQTLRALRQMRRSHYDLVIDPDPQSQSGRLLALLARKQRSLGFSGPRKSGTMTHAVDPAGAPKHHARQPVFLLRSALGDRHPERPCPPLDIRLDASERRRGHEALAQVLARQPSRAGGCIGVFTDATGNKRFDATWWKRFLDALEPAAADCRFIEVLSTAGASRLGSRYPCFYTGNVRKLASLLANCSLVISADCGVMHLACAAGVPTAGLFRVTDPAQWGPYGGANLALDTRGLDPEQAALKVLAAFHTALAA